MMLNNQTLTNTHMQQDYTQQSNNNNIDKQQEARTRINKKRQESKYKVFVYVFRMI